jgi:hypothetical protein
MKESYHLTASQECTSLAGKYLLVCARMFWHLSEKKKEKRLNSTYRLEEYAPQEY